MQLHPWEQCSYMRSTSPGTRTATMEPVDGIVGQDSRRTSAFRLSRWRHGFESRWGAGSPRDQGVPGLGPPLFMVARGPAPLAKHDEQFGAVGYPRRVGRIVDRQAGAQVASPRAAP